jgi:beta-glucosidase
MGTPLDPVGFCSCYLDVDPTPQFPFGFGLSYSPLNYGTTHIATEDNDFLLSATVTNQGAYQVCEIVQLYVRDLVANVTRPVKELKAFKRIDLAPGETKTVEFRLSPPQLAFHHRDASFEPEAGEFHAWIAANSESGSPTAFTLAKSRFNASTSGGASRESRDRR